MARWLTALTLLLVLVPAALACTSTRGPHSPVRFVAKEDGVTILDLATSISVGPNDLCGYDGTPSIAFDGRYAAWLEGTGLRVVEVATGEETRLPRGVLTDGHVAVHQGYPWQANVTLVDIANGTTVLVPAPAGQSFVANHEGAVIAVTSDGSNPQLLSVLDPVTASWRLRDVPLPSAADPWSMKLAGDRTWLLLDSIDTEGNVPLLNIATGTVSTLHTEWSQAVGVRDGRLYLTSSYNLGSSESPRQAWSIALPEGGDRQNGALPGPPVIDGIAVAFEVQPTTDTHSGTGTPTPDQTPDDSQLGGTSADGTATPSRTPDDDVFEIPAAYALALLVPAVAAWAVRRRL